jgi:LacI family transcriptional regulator
MIQQAKDRPTLVDVAREAKVSLKTASRVLNNEPNIAPATAKRVRAAMLKLSYRPNELARGLKGRHSATIGMVVPNVADPFIASAVKAVQEMARQRRFVLILASSDGDESLEREEVEILLSRQVDGLIIAPADGRHSTVDSFIAAGVPVVAFDRPMQNAEIDTITVFNEAAAREATEHLLSHGYRRILTIGARPELYTCSERLAGYSSTMKRAKLKPETLLVAQERDLTPELVHKVLNGKKPYEAVLTLNGMITMMLLQALREIGVHVGNELALVSFDDFQLANVLSPGLTVVCQPAEELGRKSAQLLFERIQGSKAIPPRKLSLSTTFLLRESCGCARESRSVTNLE